MSSIRPIEIQDDDSFSETELDSPFYNGSLDSEHIDEKTDENYYSESESPFDLSIVDSNVKKNGINKNKYIGFLENTLREEVKLSEVEADFVDAAVQEFEQRDSSYSDSELYEHEFDNHDSSLAESYYLNAEDESDEDGESYYLNAEDESDEDGESYYLNAEDESYYFDDEYRGVKTHIPASKLFWKGASREQLNFMRNVYKRHVLRASRKRKFIQSLPRNQIDYVDGSKHMLQKNAAVELNRLLDAARQDVIKENVNVKINVVSSYRSADRQFNLWPKRFRNYYKRTMSTREGFGNKHGKKALKYMVRYIGARFAAPGFSLHQSGIAVDLQPTENRRRYKNSTKQRHREKWRKTWLWNWLIKNASRYNFYQNTNINEPWHWEYRGVINNKNNLSKQALDFGDSSAISSVISKIKDTAYNGMYLYTALSAISKGERNPNKITDLVFAIKYPDLKLTKNDLRVKVWLGIKNNLVLPLLRTISKQDNVSNINDVKYPDGFRVTRRKKRIAGLSRYSEERLDTNLYNLRSKGILNISDDKIDTLQRIANVEVNGKIQGINTWDSAVVSMGFMQLTLQHGKLQNWINKAPSSFKKYGIQVDEKRKYVWKNKESKYSGILGANKNELRWSPWVERFYAAGLDEKIIAVEVEVALDYLKNHLNKVIKYINKRDNNFGSRFKKYYSQSRHLRGIFQAAYNNLPRAARRGTLFALMQARKEGFPSVNRFLDIYKNTLQKGYDLENDPEGAGRIILVTNNGARKPSG